MGLRVFHVTPSGNVPAILAIGLIPTIGPRSAEANESRPAIFCFRSREDLENALSNWLGECFDDENESDPSPLSILEINLPDTLKTFSDADYELAVIEPIAPEFIVNVLTEDWIPQFSPAQNDHVSDFLESTSTRIRKPVRFA